jgi:hypothetical protein
MTHSLPLQRTCLDIWLLYDTRFGRCIVEGSLPNADGVIHDPVLLLRSNSTRTLADDIAERSALHRQSLPCDQLPSIGNIRHGFKIIHLRLAVPFHRVCNEMLGITTHRVSWSVGTRSNGRSLLMLLSISLTCPIIYPMPYMRIFSRL